MKTRVLASIAMLSMIMFAGSAAADSIVQVWTCKAREGKTADDVAAVSSAWLKAAKTMEGGADIEVYLEYPLAADAGFGEFNFVMIVPDVKTWGVFNHGYAGSAAADADEAWNEVAKCSGSGLWESVEMK